MSTRFINDANLTAYYKLEDLNDSKGTFTLTNNNSVGFSAGKFANAGDWGNTWYNNKSLYNAAPLGLTLNSDWTVNFWVSINALSTDGTLFLIRDTTKGDTNIQYNTTVPRFDYGLNGTTGSFIFDLGTNTFHMVTLVKSSTTGYFYVDGVFKHSNSFGSGKATSIFILGNNSFGAHGAAVKIDDFSAFSRVLDASEVNEIFNGAAGTKLDLTSKIW
jgi:hypothetical protein